MKTIDCRNMACPAPVVATRRALAEGGEGPLEVQVDSCAARGNVTCFAANRGYSVTERPLEQGVSLVIKTGAEKATHMPTSGECLAGERLMLITSNYLGDGPDKLGNVLMRVFIITLLELEQLPDRIIFLNSGVKMVIEGSEVLEALHEVERRGVEILSCSLCLDFFNAKEKLAVGGVTNMPATAERLLQADTVINL